MPVRTMARRLAAISHVVLSLCGLVLAEPVMAQGLRESSALIAKAKRLYNTGKYDEAMQLTERVVAILEHELGRDHPDFATALNDLAENYDNLGRHSQAEPHYKRALAIREKVLVRWPRLFGQFFRFDEWNLCRG